jgi:RNA polymerase sigma factor (sigma-70 family)
MTTSHNTTGIQEQPGWFNTTHWSVVLHAGEQSSSQAAAALGKLCETYWYPLYLFARRQGQPVEDAQDLVQGFFARVVEKDYIAVADRNKGTFRSFLLLAFKRYMANEWDRANRLKRGGGQAIVSLDEQNTEMRYREEPVDEMSPEKAFERRWAVTVLDKVRERLENEMAAVGKAKIFAELKAFLSGAATEDTYADLGNRLGMSESSIKVTVHRLRQRYRELLRLEIANTVANPEAIDQEIQDLFAALN